MSAPACPNIGTLSSRALALLLQAWPGLRAAPAPAVPPPEVRAMQPTKKAARDCPPAASKNTCCRNFIASRIKVLIVNLALWGVIPFGLSVWLIRRLQLVGA